MDKKKKANKAKKLTRKSVSDKDARAVKGGLGYKTDGTTHDPVVKK